MCGTVASTAQQKSAKTPPNARDPSRREIERERALGFASGHAASRASAQRNSALSPVATPRCASHPSCLMQDLRGRKLGLRGFGAHRQASSIGVWCCRALRTPVRGVVLCGCVFPWSRTKDKPGFLGVRHWLGSLLCPHHPSVRCKNYFSSPPPCLPESLRDRREKPLTVREGPWFCLGGLVERRT